MLKAKLVANGIKAGAILPSHHDDPADLRASESFRLSDDESPLTELSTQNCSVLDAGSGTSSGDMAEFEDVFSQRFNDDQGLERPEKLL